MSGVDPESYKRSLRKFASGITIVTVASNGDLHGMTATSFASVSLEPPLILVSLEKRSFTHDLVLASRSFAVNVLAADQEPLARDFARRGEKSFAGIECRRSASGAPLIAGCLAWLECDITEVVPGGDHDVVVARVVASDTREGAPLIYFERAYRVLEQPVDPQLPVAPPE